MKSELTVMKVRCDESMIGQDIIIPATPKSSEALKSLPYAKKMHFNAKYSDLHDLERHGLFWACIRLVSKNLGETQRQIEEKCKINCRWIDSYINYIDKNGKTRVHIIPKSISFDKMTLEDADKFYSIAFDVLASYLNISVETLTTEAKMRMKTKYYCLLCGKRAVHRHHLFSKTKWAIAKYGKELINAEFNIVWLCVDCHISHANVPKDLIWTENRFIAEAKKRGYLND